MSKELALFLTRFAAALRVQAALYVDADEVERGALLADIARAVFVAGAIAEDEAGCE